MSATAAHPLTGHRPQPYPKWYTLRGMTTGVTCTVSLLPYLVVTHLFSSCTLGVTISLQLLSMKFSFCQTWGHPAAVSLTSHIFQEEYCTFLTAISNALKLRGKKSIQMIHTKKQTVLFTSCPLWSIAKKTLTASMKTSIKSNQSLRLQCNLNDYKSDVNFTILLAPRGRRGWKKFYAVLKGTILYLQKVMKENHNKMTKL